MKKISRIISVVLLFIMIFSTSVIIASAGNTADTSWVFIFTTSPQSTVARDKENTTKIYWKVNTVDPGYSYTVKPFAQATGGAVDCSHGIIKTISEAKVYYLTNYIREDGYYKAFVRGYASQAFSSTGVWSPDNSSGI